VLEVFDAKGLSRWQVPDLRALLERVAVFCICADAAQLVCTALPTGAPAGWLPGTHARMPATLRATIRTLLFIRSRRRRSGGLGAVPLEILVVAFGWLRAAHAGPVIEW
jgi:hypothetical protein